MCLFQNTKLFCTQCRGIRTHLSARENLMVFLELQQEPWVYFSRDSYQFSRGVRSFRQLQRFPETPVLSLEKQQFQDSNSRNFPCTLYHLKMRADSLASTEEQANNPQAFQEEASLSNTYVRGTLSLLPQEEWTPRCPDSKKTRFPCSGLNAGSYFMSQDEGMSESTLETLEKD